ncbi:hypothetical protein RFI_10460 [Reticulomyxa filosa]|uniref:CAP-Gly domain-containing protein n=1 Tax=Reticulomyxa filosa TaxID=46433 RepID=X6NLR3_RETFI|nr:hypothetical protein RFI_10460 [Reticulomyxa filosa]|eukprot:ETO26674.1 hypothetical protein RFI_10460 [Reticulomyxa filosa]
MTSKGDWSPARYDLTNVGNTQEARTSAFVKKTSSRDLTSSDDDYPKRRMYGPSDVGGPIDWQPAEWADDEKPFRTGKFLEPRLHVEIQKKIESGWWDEQKVEPKHGPRDIGTANYSVPEWDLHTGSTLRISISNCLQQQYVCICNIRPGGLFEERHWFNANKRSSALSLFKMDLNIDVNAKSSSGGKSNNRRSSKIATDKGAPSALVSRTSVSSLVSDKDMTPTPVDSSKETPTPGPKMFDDRLIKIAGVWQINLENGMKGVYTITPGKFANLVCVCFVAVVYNTYGLVTTEPSELFGWQPPINIAFDEDAQAYGIECPNFSSVYQFAFLPETTEQLKELRLEHFNDETSEELNGTAQLLEAIPVVMFSLFKSEDQNSIKLDDFVKVKKSNSKFADFTGYIRYIGKTHISAFANKEMIGIELSGTFLGRGDNNGVVDNRKYFRCPELGGILVESTSVELHQQTSAVCHFDTFKKKKTEGGGKKGTFFKKMFVLNTQEKAETEEKVEQETNGNDDIQSQNETKVDTNKQNDNTNAGNVADEKEKKEDTIVYVKEGLLPMLGKWRVILTDGTKGIYSIMPGNKQIS